MMLKDINAPLQQLAVPIGIALITVLLARAISVYLPSVLYNKTKLQSPIPLSYQHLLVRGSLRGALGLTLALMIPDTLHINGWTYDYSIKEFVIVLTISTIIFSLIVQ
ncbi:MAG: hypothetical protein H6765_08935 [Candidatus Peribacteria bacterium]|nr:MAG: hypothetical protein H6765_08935 [Candidatus Peribacteria bacterium]